MSKLTQQENSKISVVVRKERQIFVVIVKATCSQSYKSSSDELVTDSEEQTTQIQRPTGEETRTKVPHFSSLRMTREEEELQVALPASRLSAERAAELDCDVVDNQRFRMSNTLVVSP